MEKFTDETERDQPKGGQDKPADNDVYNVWVHVTFFLLLFFMSCNSCVTESKNEKKLDAIMEHLNIKVEK